MKTEEAAFAWEGGSVSGVWHHPDKGRDYLILAHGGRTPSREKDSVRVPLLVPDSYLLSLEGVGIADTGETESHSYLIEKLRLWLSSSTPSKNK